MRAGTGRHPPLLLIPPPLLYVACFGAGLLLSHVLPWSPGWFHNAPLRWIGRCLLAAAALLAIASAGGLLRRKTTLIPHGQPTRLITGGPYRLSRNPIYLALTAAYGGGALWLGKLWPLVLLVVPVMFLHRIVIPFEEQRLGEAFGQQYVDYCRRVRRWI